MRNSIIAHSDIGLWLFYRNQYSVRPCMSIFIKTYRVLSPCIQAENMPEIAYKIDKWDKTMYLFRYSVNENEYKIFKLLAL
jgi:hypothetical protein